MNKFKLIVLIIFIFILQDNLLAITEQATFKVFYVEDSYIGWIVAGIFAVVSAAVIFFTGGTASPIVIGMGTWIGEVAGLSGAAATNYGLALLGGGSVASGGAGMIGGIAVLSAALGFTTDIVIDYSLGNVINKYSYNKFVEDSKKMLTLPIPQNESGSDEYENTIVYLKNNINQKETLFSNSNQMVLNKALMKLLNKLSKIENLMNQIRLKSDIPLDIKQKISTMSYINIKDSVLLSYLYFVTNQYKNAKKQAMISIELSRKSKIRRTLPSFIYATSSLYDTRFDFNIITKNYFRYSILAESDNKLIPTMFAIYLDRVLYRMNDDEKLNYKTLNKIRDISFEIKEKDIRLQSMIIVLMRYYIRLFVEEQKIITLTTKSNSTIRNNIKTLKIVKNAFLEYNNLLLGMKNLVNNKQIQEQIKQTKNTQIKQLNISYIKYLKDKKRYLKLQINNLEKYQHNIVF